MQIGYKNPDNVPCRQYITSNIEDGTYTNYCHNVPRDYKGVFYKEITFETFMENIFPLTKYRIPNTELPISDALIEYRCSKWKPYLPNEKGFILSVPRISYGYEIYNEVVYIKVEKVGYDFHNFYLIPESSLITLNNKTINNDKRFPLKLSESNAKRILNISCESWKLKLSKKWGADLIYLGYTTIDETFYKEMRNVCTQPQHVLFDEIFGKDEIEWPYKQGDLIFVKHSPSDEWYIRYFSHVENNEVFTFINQQKVGSTVSWNYHAPAVGVVLPNL